MVQIPRYINVEVTGCIGMFALVCKHVFNDPHICDLLSRLQLFTPLQIGPKPHGDHGWSGFHGKRRSYSYSVRNCAALSKKPVVRIYKSSEVNGWTRCRLSFWGSDRQNISEPPGL